jgi:hypothetical protein|tara:strand:+ start:496 stop:1629 length:1134 start_codon:yes stop_codon:yes gene_type:complete
MHNKVKTILALTSLFILLGCQIELPSPPPNVLYKFKVLKVGNGPADILTTDLNLDGSLDLVTANTKNNTLSILLGIGDGTFKKTLTFSVGSEPTVIVSGDVNNDGIPDLLTNSRGSGLFTVLLGYGNGAFRRMPRVLTGRIPLAIIPADFNNDGNLDVAVTLTFNKMEIFLGSGNGLFKKEKIYPTVSRSLSGVVGDFNDDSKVDIILATHSSSSSGIRLFKGNGDGTFSKPVSFSKNLSPLILITQDMNNNGLQDLVFSSGQGDNMYMLISRGDGTFENEVIFSGGGGPISLTAGHFNSDNMTDVAVANSRSSNFSFIARSADGHFQHPTRDYFVDGGTPLAITSGDFNNDAMTDIAVASNAKNTIEIYLQRRVFK